MLRRLAAIALLMLLSPGCIVVTFFSNGTHMSTLSTGAATYPLDHPYDWFWAGLAPDAMSHVRAMSASNDAAVRVCFPATSVARMYLSWAGPPVGFAYSWRTDAGCTEWAPAAWCDEGAAGFPCYSFGWQRMVTIGAGETVQVQVRVAQNYRAEPWDLPVSARVGAADPVTGGPGEPIWWDFGAEPPPVAP